MKRLGTGVIAAAFATSLGLTLGITASPLRAQPAADFGSPPSGEVPVLFNDRHVYARPDRLRQGRVLTAIVRGNTILVPMRSVFEQMGAAVSYDRSTKSVDVKKPGADVKVTVGKPEVVVNGETRPLDVPPEIYKGSLVVPLRVLSEGMGAYVQWVSDKRLVAIRYASAPVPTPPPAPPATVPPAATPAPAALPAPGAARARYERFVVGDYLFAPRVYNELSPGNTGKSSFRIAAAAEFSLFKLPWMLEGDLRSFRYPHEGSGSTTCPSGAQGCVNLIGTQGAVYVPTFQARDDDFDGRFGLKIADPKIYIGVGYVFRNTNYEGGAFPTQQHGLSLGLEKLPDLAVPFSMYGSVYYYPNTTTNDSQQLGNGVLGAVQYRVLKYNVGGTFSFRGGPLFLDLGYLGDRANVKQNAPVDTTHGSAYAGLGVHF